MVKIEKAKISDAPQIHKLVNYFADRGAMLARSLSEIYENIRDFYVAVDGSRVVGCAALHIMWADLSEIKSLAVEEEYQEKGVGDKLMDACIKEAKSLGTTTIFCLTYKPAFFERLGFAQLDKMKLPQKVWTECYRCPKFPNCDEVALTYKFEA